jgi:hypothetical protein
LPVARRLLELRITMQPISPLDLNKVCGGAAGAILGAIGSAAGGVGGLLNGIASLKTASAQKKAMEAQAAGGGGGGGPGGAPPPGAIAAPGMGGDQVSVNVSINGVAQR